MSGPAPGGGLADLFACLLVQTLWRRRACTNSTVR